MKKIKIAAIAIIGFLIVAQAFRINKTNPPVEGDVQAPPPVEHVLMRSCYNCHSNKTVWPWYSNVAPASWLTQSDVEEARSLLNFSDWSPAQKGNPHAAAEVREGDMPPWDFLLMHKEARLSDSERETLARGLQATLAAARP